MRARIIHDAFPAQRLRSAAFLRQLDYEGMELLVYTDVLSQAGLEESSPPLVILLVPETEP